jgi:hypothetical protein
VDKTMDFTCGYAILYDMNNKIFSINWTNIKSAIISTVLTAILAMAVYVVSLNDIFVINLHTLINIGSISLLTGIISLIKSFLTTDTGRFLGTTKISDTPKK